VKRTADIPASACPETAHAIQDIRVLAIEGVDHAVDVLPERDGLKRQPLQAGPNPDKVGVGGDPRGQSRHVCLT